MHKNHFNDPLPSEWSYILICSSCRVKAHIKAKFYPHTNHREITECPFCGAEGDSIQVNRGPDAS